MKYVPRRGRGRAEDRRLAELRSGVDTVISRMSNEPIQIFFTNWFTLDGGFIKDTGTVWMSLHVAIHRYPMTPLSNPDVPVTYTHAVKANLLNRILLILSFVGLFVAGALTIEKLMNVDLPCGESHGCATVARDPSSMLFGVIPVAYIGLAGYILFAGLAIARTMGKPNDERLTKLGFYASIIGATYSVYLQYLSFFHIHAVCPYCLTSAITMLLTVTVYTMLKGTIVIEETQASELGKLDMWLVGGLPLVVMVTLGMMASSDQTVHSGKLVGATITNPTYDDLVSKTPKAYGPEVAPMTIVEFADLCCPACQDKSPKVKQFVSSHYGKIRLVFRNFPLNMHPLSRVAATVGEIAHERGRFWDYAMGVMGLNRQPESAAEILDIAKGCGLDKDEIRRRLKDSKDPVFQRVTDDLNLGHQVGVNSTPTFFILTKGHPAASCGPKEILDLLASKQYESILKP